MLVFQDLKGSQLFQSPENKFAFNANYTFDFTPGSLILSGTYTWTDSTIYQPFNDPAFEVPAYGTGDLRAIWKDADNKYTLIASVKNVTDEEGFTSTGSTNPTAVFGDPNPGLVVGGKPYLRQTGVAITRGLIQPRTYGLELQYRFKIPGASARGFCNNIKGGGAIRRPFMRGSQKFQAPATHGGAHNPQFGNLTSLQALRRILGIVPPPVVHVPARLLLRTGHQ
uniref:TonB-dependent receptor n=1 Tax=Phenylobacterium glaciei TaxID=2803784 RepID=A0A974SAL5_9CAUL|nr:TonB-dependent receptor [Phenylobacterium glaciei]